MITEYFLTFPIFSCGKMGKNVPNGKVFFQIEHFFLPIWKNILLMLEKILLKKFSRA